MSRQGQYYIRRGYVPRPVYSEMAFLKSLPDMYASVDEVCAWMARGKASQYAGSDPAWLDYQNLDGHDLHHLPLPTILDHLSKCGLRRHGAEWLAERIIFAKGLRTGIKEQLSWEIRDEILPEFIEEMRSQIIDEVKDEMKEELKEEMKYQLRREFTDEIINTLKAQVKEDIMQELRQQIRDGGEDEGGDEAEDEDEEEDLIDLATEESDEGSSEPEPAHLGRGIKRDHDFAEEEAIFAQAEIPSDTSEGSKRRRK